MRKPMVVLLSLLAGMFVFITACQKEYSVEVTKIGAEGSLQDSTGNCLQDSVVGTYYGGVTPGSDTAYLQVMVNVTKAGSYTIYTDKQNGMSFSDSGYFSATGITTIKLKPVGAPIIPGSFDYNVTFDSTVCYFTLVVQDSTGTGLGGGSTPVTQETWAFTGPSGTYSGLVDTAFTADSLGINYLHIIGFNATGDSVWQIGAAFSGGSIATGSYSTKSAGAFNFAKAATGDVIYRADPLLTTPDVTTTIVISSYDATTKVITGTFSGTASDASGNVVNISSGSFTATVH